MLPYFVTIYVDSNSDVTAKKTLELRIPNFAVEALL
jgi:hypothetical protein